MLYSQKYCLVSFISPVNVNTEFEMLNWPLHITLADVFAVEVNTSLKEELQKLITKESQIVTTAASEAVLGVTRVVLLNKDDKLQKLHDHLIDLLQSSGAIFNNPEFVKKGFLPHCTIQKNKRLNLGDTFKINEITLVDMFPDNNWCQRRVLHNFNLGSELQ